MSSSYRRSLEDWLSQLDVKANRVLDIGGAQLPVKNRTSSWDVDEYVIGDLPQPHAGSPIPDITIDLNDGITQHFQTYDLVFCLEVFEYVYNPVNALENIALALLKGGTAWVTFPSVYPLHQPVEDDALRYMPGGINKLAASAGLTVVQMIKRRPDTNLLQQFYSAEGMRAAKGEDHNFTGFIVEFTK